MALNLWLIDKSAYARLDRTPDSDLWASRISRGLVQISSLTRLEIGFSFRNYSEASREATSPPLLTMPIAYLTPAIEDRAVEVQMLLTQSGHHRGPSIPDLVIAADRGEARHECPARGHRLRPHRRVHWPACRVVTH